MWVIDKADVYTKQLQILVYSHSHIRSNCADNTSYSMLYFAIRRAKTHSCSNLFVYPKYMSDAEVSNVCCCVVHVCAGVDVVDENECANVYIPAVQILYILNRTRNAHRTGRGTAAGHKKRKKENILVKWCLCMMCGVVWWGAGAERWLRVFIHCKWPQIRLFSQWMNDLSFTNGFSVYTPVLMVKFCVLVQQIVHRTHTHSPLTSSFHFGASNIYYNNIIFVFIIIITCVSVVR